MATGLLTIPQVPSYNSELEENPLVRSVALGNNYSQDIRDGLNPIAQHWAEVFNARSDQEAEDILAFLRSAGGDTPFWWINPNSAYTVAKVGTGVADGVRTTFQLWRPGITGSQGQIKDWQGAWPFYDKPRVNIGIRTEDVTQTAWIKLTNGTGSAPVVTANYAAAPDGFSMTADRIQFQQGSGTTASDYSLVQIQVASSPAVVVGQTYSMSIWLKTADGSTQTIYLVTNGFSGFPSTTLVVTGQWQQFLIPNLTSTVLNNVKMQFGTRGTYTPANSTADILAFGYQFEAGPVCTRYIANPNSTAIMESPTYSVVGGFRACDYFTSEPQVYLNDWNGESLLYKTPRTNFIQKNQQLDDAIWVKSATTVTANATAAPDGTTTADKLIATAVTSQHYCYQAMTSILADNSATVFSIFAKAAEYSNLQMRVLGAGSTIYLGLFDLAAVTATPGAGSPQVGITRLSNGWFRCWVAIPSTGALGAGLSNALIYMDNGSGNNFLGDGTSGIYLWGAQEEQFGLSVLAGATFAPTAYIATTTAAVTVTDYTLTSTGQLTMGYVLPASTAAIPVYLTWSGSGAVRRQVKCRKWKRGLETFNKNKITCDFVEDFT